MAGDWIKMRIDLHDDPAVVGMAIHLDRDEDSVVGKLHRLWSWADRHTTNGSTTGITLAWIDRYVECKGFAEAMIKAKWLECSGEIINFPNFDRHNGESAKKRADATIRQRLSREMRDKGVTGGDRDNIPRPFKRAVYNRDAYTCVYCGAESDEKQEGWRNAILSIDHLTPNTRGGKTTMENLVTACRACNREKNDRTPEEWGFFPEFLQNGLIYSDGLVTSASHKQCDNVVTREEKSERREEITTVRQEPIGSRSPKKFSGPPEGGWLDLSGVDWCHVQAMAERVANKIAPVTDADRRQWLKFAVLASFRFSEHWLFDSVEAVLNAKESKGNRRGHLVSILQSKANEDGVDLETFKMLMKRIDIPRDEWKCKRI